MIAAKNADSSIGEEESVVVVVFVRLSSLKQEPDRMFVVNQAVLNKGGNFHRMMWSGCVSGQFLIEGKARQLGVCPMDLVSSKNGGTGPPPGEKTACCLNTTTFSLIPESR